MSSQRAVLPLEALESASRTTEDALDDVKVHVQGLALSGMRSRIRRSRRSTRVSGASARSRSRTTTTRSRRRSAARRSRPGPLSLWRYSDLLPVAGDTAVDLGTGFTPLVKADRLAAELGLGEVWIKNDTRNPTNSFKDRVVSVALSARRSSSASRSRRARRPATSRTRSPRTRRAPGCAATCSFPSNLEQGKIVTTAVYGGNLVAINGNYDDVNRLCAELAGVYEWAFVNVNMRPFYAEGSKTLAFETAEQLGWQTPDHVVVPVASGSLLTKIRKGFDELHKVGLLDEEPQVRVSGAQALGLLAGREGVHRGVRHDPAGEARHDRQVARDREPGRRLLRARRRALDGRRLRGGHRRARSSTACGCSPAPRASSPRPPAA